MPLFNTREELPPQAGKETRVLPLPVAGIMTNGDGYEVAKAYADIDDFVKTKMGCVLTSPFMTLSFMAFAGYSPTKIE